MTTELRIVTDEPTYEAIVVETGPGYVVTADLEEVPEHNHFDWRDATDDCPRCEYDALRAEG